MDDVVVAGTAEERGHAFFLACPGEHLGAGHRELEAPRRSADAAANSEGMEIGAPWAALPSSPPWTAAASGAAALRVAAEAPAPAIALRRKCRRLTARVSSFGMYSVLVRFVRNSRIVYAIGSSRGKHDRPASAADRARRGIEFPPGLYPVSIISYGVFRLPDAVVAGPIDDQQLALDEHGFGARGTAPPGPASRPTVRQEMQKQDDRIAQGTIMGLAKSRKMLEIWQFQAQAAALFHGVWIVDSLPEQP